MPLCCVTCAHGDPDTAVRRLHAPLNTTVECVLKAGVNRFEECKELRDKLWAKMHEPNYGAPGPPRGTSRWK